MAGYGEGELSSFGRIFSMVLRHQLPQSISQLVREGMLFSRGSKSDLGLNGERGQTLVCLIGQVSESGDVPNQSRGHSDEIRR